MKKSLLQESQEQYPSQKYGFMSILKKRDEVRKQDFRMPEYEKFSWKPTGCGLLPEAKRMTCGYGLLLKEAAVLIAG
ncbi:hypothetical protein VU06_04685, partial [Desulfobulbus sp. F3]|nr:hypothetical protein [Desulfobulbus sp. F3]